MHRKSYNSTSSGKRGIKYVIRNILITLLIGVVYYYFNLPALNIHAVEFYVFLFILLAVYTILTLLFSGKMADAASNNLLSVIKRQCRIPLILCVILFAGLAIGAVSSWVVLRSGSYSELLVPTSSDFTQDVTEISFDQIPMLDEESAIRLGDRKLGELSDMVSQFEVSDEYSQINYLGKPTRVTYLNYGDFFKWIGNQKSGLPAYISIDMVTQEVTVVRLEQGMRYSPSELFFRDIERYLRIHYPTAMFSDINFEVDEEGNPWWICSVMEKTIGLFGGSDICGAVLVNAVTGEHMYYPVEEIPTWVDRVYNANLIVEQYDYHGTYQNGFWNSLFGQKNVTVTTDGYNYIALNDDVWVYTGITSVTGDESNIGFILVNQRTKEAKYYAIAGAEEYSAMSSAEGVVQHLNYKATFPLLLNISSEPTYFIALKDNVNLVKMYAMVNVQQYQIVATGATVSECQSNYNKQLLENNITEEVTEPVAETSTVTGVITDIRTAVLSGDTNYYFALDESAQYYRVNASTCESAVIAAIGDTATITFETGEDEILTAIEIRLK